MDDEDLDYLFQHFDEDVPVVSHNARKRDLSDVSSLPPRKIQLTRRGGTVNNSSQEADTSDHDFKMSSSVTLLRSEEKEVISEDASTAAHRSEPMPGFVNARSRALRRENSRKAFAGPSTKPMVSQPLEHRLINRACGFRSDHHRTSVSSQVRRGSARENSASRLLKDFNGLSATSSGNCVSFSSFARLHSEVWNSCMPKLPSVVDLVEAERLQRNITVGVTKLLLGSVGCVEHKRVKYVSGLQTDLPPSGVDFLSFSSVEPAVECCTVYVLVR